MAKTTKKAGRNTSGKRELITPTRGASRFQRRKRDGTFGDADMVGRSLAGDRRRKAKKTVKSGYGDRGDR